MHRSAFAALFAVIILSLPYVSFSAFVGLPFGGLVTEVQECNEGLLLWIAEPQEDGLTTITLPFLWYWGNLPYAYYIIPNIGQWVLGMAGLTPVECTLGTYVEGVGFPILFHGGSMIP